MALAQTANAIEVDKRAASAIEAAGEAAPVKVATEGGVAFNLHPASHFKAKASAVDIADLRHVGETPSAEAARLAQEAEAAKEEVVIEEDGESGEA